MTNGELSALARSFEEIPYCAALGIRVESIQPDRVRLRVPYKDENSNPGKALHGGVAASSIDIAGTLAAWTRLERTPGLETGILDLSVNYLAAAIGEDIVVDAEVMRRGKEIVYSDVDVRNDSGKRIARGLVTYRAVDHVEASPAASRQHQTAAEDLPATGDVPPLARAFVSVPFIGRLGMTPVHMAGGEAVLRMPFSDTFSDGNGAMHEGALAALLDTAGSMAAWSITGLDFTYKASTVGIHVNYHAPLRADEAVAHARTLRRNNEIFLNQVTISARASRQVVATGSVTYRIVIPG